jgi:hypothetical protein
MTARDTLPARFYEVRLPDHLWSGETVQAKSPAAAKYAYYINIADALGEMSFPEFLKELRPQVRVIPRPADDGYGYVRRIYGVNPRIGQHVQLDECAPRQRTIIGTVVYPMGDRHYIHVEAPEVWDGPRVVHPLSVTLLDAEPTP